MKSDKLDENLIKGRFVGYAKDNLRYYFYLPTEQVVVVSKDAIFLEKEFLKEGGKEKKIMSDVESSKEAQQIDQTDFDQPEEPIPIKNVITPTSRRTSRVSCPSKRYSFLHDMQEFHVHEESMMILLHIKKLYVIKIL